MDFIDKVKEIAMTSLLVLYNTNLVPLAICASPSLANAEQQGSSAYKNCKNMKYSFLKEGRKPRKKNVCGVVIKKISTRTSSSHVSIPRSSHCYVVRKRKMIDDEHLSSDISTRLDISFVEPSQITTITREDNVKDFNDDDIGTKMNKQVPLKNLSPPKVKLNYD